MAKRIAAAITTIIMLVFCIPFSAVAVTGSQVAADGLYSSTLTGYKKGEAKYSATLGVQVEGGKIAELWLSNASDSKMYKAFSYISWENYVGITATADEVNAVDDEIISSGYDGVSSASMSASKDSSKKYSVNLKEAILTALSKAPVSANASSGSSDPDSSILTGSSTVDAYNLTLNVAVSDGKISDIAVAEGSTGTWDSVLEKAKAAYVGKTQAAAASDVDATSSATKYSAAFYTALGNALNVAADEPVTTTASAGGGSAGTTVTTTAAVKTYNGNGGVQNITIKVGETIKLVSSYSSNRYRVWITSEWNDDEQLYTDDSDENGNTITVVGKAASGSAYQTYRYYTNNLTSNSEEFRITVEPGTTTTTEPVTTTTTTVAVPDHVKSISGSDDDYTIKLNVVGKDVTTKTSSTVTTPGETVDKGTNLVIVIDISGSIVGKESALNSAIKSLVQGLPDSSQVGVVVFNENAGTSKVYDKSTISGLSFAGVKDAGTNMATGIAAATSLLNGNGWSDKSNNKAMVIISDFDADDYTNSINNAKTAKAAGTKIYSVKIDTTEVGTASSTELTTDNRTASIPAFTRYVSSQYPAASAVNNSMFGVFNQATVTPGTADNSATYVYGAGGGNWSSIFAKIKETQNITETVETETTLSTQVTEIYDVLSEYAELSGTGSNYGITVTNDGTPVSSFTAAYDSSVRKVTVKFTSPVTVADGKELAVMIPVKPSAAAREAANSASSLTSVFFTNQGASLSYQYGDNTAESAYAEKPVITLKKHSTFKLSFDADGGEKAPAALTQTVSGSASATFTIPDAVPTKDGYTFDYWYEEGDDNAAEYTAGKTITIYGDTTLKAHWTEKPRYTVVWKNDDGTVLETDENLAQGVIPSYDGSTPQKAATAQYTYEFAGWSPEVTEVTGNAVYTARYTPTVKKYTIRFLDEDGTTVLETQSVEYGDTPVYSGIAPTKAGDAEHNYVFAGWTPSVTAVTGDQDYKAGYTEGTNSYTVKFEDYDKKELKSEVLEYGSEPTPPEDPVRDDVIDENDIKHVYTFKGWDPTVNPVTGNAVYTAVYSEKLMYRIFIDDYTNGIAKVNGIKSGDYYDTGDVSFTVEASQAVAFGIDNEDDTYTRLYCTDNGNGSYTFTVTLTDSDIYLVEGFKGDADLNGAVQLRDATLINKVKADKASLSDIAAFIGDADGDDSIKLRDATLINKVKAEKDTTKWDIEK
ncbi:MAG: InlB B-repeat-containing protein [Ruminococcus sp.]|nr:InlB B-repeat-containing protein [Ruminococcus sp.]